MSKPAWLDRTEVVAGLMLRKKIDPNLVNPEDMYPPYGEIVPILRDGGSTEDVVGKVSYSIVRDAIAAADAILSDKATKPLGWLDLLQKSASRFKSGTDLEQVAKDLKDGKEVDLGKVMLCVSQIETGYRGLTPFDEVKAESAQWILTGYEPVDKYIGGVPKAGMILLAASTGVGKTTFVLRLGLSMLRKYKKKKVAIFSLEMLLSQVKARLLNLDPNITDQEFKRLLGSDTAYTSGEVYSTAAQYTTKEDLSLIIVDFADLMVEKEQSEAVMGQIYLAMSRLAKTTGVPLLLIGQLNRETYKGGIPKIHHIRYSGMAEILSSLMWLLYNPAAIVADHAADSILPFSYDHGYLIFGKSRFGFKMEQPGAVQIEWDGKKGWGSIGQHYYPVNV